MESSDTVKIESKIVGFSVVDNDKEIVEVKVCKKDREEVLTGKTYKVPIPNSENMYITINDLNEKPFEIFINSKDTEHFQWVSALTRVMSAVLRREDDIDFMVKELKNVVDPNGGYWKKGKFVPSIVHEIGIALETHIGASKDVPVVKEGLKCKSCGEFTVTKVDGCLTCRSCGDSKCG